MILRPLKSCFMYVNAVNGYTGQSVLVGDYYLLPGRGSSVRNFEAERPDGRGLLGVND